MVDFAPHYFRHRQAKHADYSKPYFLINYQAYKAIHQPYIKRKCTFSQMHTLLITKIQVYISLFVACFVFVCLKLIVPFDTANLQTLFEIQT